MHYAGLRVNLSTEVANLVRDMIVDGRLPAGSKVNEVRLAAEIGVSRTPLREALPRLAAEGALEDLPRRGFFVRPLTALEVRAIYPIRAILDPAALRLAGLPSINTLARLNGINRDLAKCADPVEIVVLDDQFHLELIASCPNAVLVDLIRQFMLRTRRYELGLQRRRTGMPGAVAANDRMIAMLEQGDLDGACKEVEGSMMRGQAPVLEWLAERETKQQGDP